MIRGVSRSNNGPTHENKTLYKNESIKKKISTQGAKVIQIYFIYMLSVQTFETVDISAFHVHIHPSIRQPPKQASKSTNASAKCIKRHKARGLSLNQQRQQQVAGCI